MLRRRSKSKNPAVQKPRNSRHSQDHSPPTSSGFPVHCSASQQRHKASFSSSPAPQPILAPPPAPEYYLPESITPPVELRPPASVLNYHQPTSFDTLHLDSFSKEMSRFGQTPNLETASMQELIPVINQLQDVFTTVGENPLDLPQIVVIGAQSSGKSSILESVCRKPFLPRGSGICTRRPLVLQLINTPADKTKSGDENAYEEWGEFLHKEGELFYDFNEIRREIERETERVSGRNKGISAKAINLKVYSPHVINLTLVDLPGMTRNPVGDQPEDIERQIRRMVLTYIEKPNAIILAVSAANTDLANSDSLKLARQVDPQGLRTIGVITKLDLMDKGTDAMDVLTGRVIPLKLGYIGVVNRGQSDIDSGKSIEDSLKAEHDFFARNATYRSVADRAGTVYLGRTLNRILLHHIRECLPELRAKVNEMLADAQRELATYGTGYSTTDTKSKGALLLQIITSFSRSYAEVIEGSNSTTMSKEHELVGGARINYVFANNFGSHLQRMDALTGLTTADIRTAIKNATGPRAALFVPEQSFDLLVKRQIKRLEEPAIQCVELVFQELQRIVQTLETSDLNRFQELRLEIVHVVARLLGESAEPTRQMIRNLIAIELAYINTNHPDFVGGGGALHHLFETEMKKYKAQQEQTARLAPDKGWKTIDDDGRAIQAQLPASSGGGHPLQSQSDSSKKSLAMKQQQQQQQAIQQQHQQAQQQQGQPSQGQPQQQGFFNSFFHGDQQQQQSSQSQSAQALRNKKNKRGAMRVDQNDATPSTSRNPLRRGGAGARPERLTARQEQNLNHMPSNIRPGSEMNNQEELETRLISELLVSYFGIVRKRILDSVPKAIMHFLVNETKQRMQNELVAALYREDRFDALLEENAQVAARRIACEEMIERLHNVHVILQSVRGFDPNFPNQNMSGLSNAFSQYR